MKHQYFGDVNDYRKYGLLRVLQARTQLDLGVWWMLTPDDHGSDGRIVDYLANPGQWRGYDPQLFDALADAVPRGRTIAHVGRLGLLPGARFIDDVVPDARAERRLHFAAVRDSLRGIDLAFVDPDIGIEVPSRPPGMRGSSKYVRWREVERLYGAGSSLVIYQHFPRERRELFVERMAGALAERTGAPDVACLTTAHVAFFVVPQPRHESALGAAAATVEESWQGQITAWFLGAGTAPGPTAIA